MTASNDHVRLAVVERDIDTIKQTAKALDHKLFGNGQPGVLDKMERRLSEIESTMAFRLANIETKMSRILLIVVGLSAASGAGGLKIAQSIIGVM